MLSRLQSQQNLEKSHYQQDNIRFAPKSVREVFACLHGKRDSLFRTKITNKQIMAWTGLSKASVQRATRWLEEHGYFHKQYWISSPCYNDPTVYILEEEYRTQQWQSFLTSFFKNLCKFAVFTLLSMTASGEDDVPLLLKRNYGIDIEMIRRVREPETFKSMFIDRHRHPEIEVSFASHQARQAYLGQSKTAPRGTPSSLETKTHKGERVSTVNNQLPFTEDQLHQLADFSKEAIDHANKALTRELMTGKQIGNQFGYFLSCCRNFKPNLSSKSVSSRSTSPSQIESMRRNQSQKYNEFLDRREQNRYNRLLALGYNPDALDHFQKVDILSRDRMSYYTGEDYRNPESL